jgi:hypothetical protein
MSHFDEVEAALAALADTDAVALLELLFNPDDFVSDVGGLLDGG